jgi:hypothetical protein
MSDKKLNDSNVASYGIYDPEDDNSFNKAGSVAGDEERRTIGLMSAIFLIFNRIIGTG